MSRPSRPMHLGLLTKHFFGRFFDTEVFAAPRTEMHHLFVQILALLVLPGLFKAIISIPRYATLAWFPIAERDRALLIDAHFFLCFSMMLTGFVTIFEWDALFPDRKDFYNLTPLPISPKALFFAKVSALSLFMVLFHIAVNGLPTLLFPGAVLSASNRPGSAGWMIPPDELFRYQISHALTLFLSTVFMFSSLIAFRAVFLVILPAKLIRTVSRYVQLGMILILLCALFYGGNADRLVKESDPLIYWLPPFWFLGMYEILLGHVSAAFSTLAHMAYAAAAVSISVSVIGYTISYQYSMQKGFHSAGIATYPVSVFRKFRNWILRKTLLRKSMHRASFHFVAQTVFRRQEHLFYWGSFAAIGIALIYSDITAITTDYLSVHYRYLNLMLSFPLMFSFFVLLGLRFVFSIPADLDANWIFKIVEQKRLAAAYPGVHRFMHCVIVIPVLLVFTPFYLGIWDYPLVLKHILYVLTLSAILIEILLLTFRKLPFTCSYLPGKTRIQLWMILYILACILYSYGMTVLETWMLNHPSGYFVTIAVFATILFALTIRRTSFLRENSTIQFEEQESIPLNILSLES